MDGRALRLDELIGHLAGFLVITKIIKLQAMQPQNLASREIIFVASTNFGFCLREVRRVVFRPSELFGGFSIQELLSEIGP